MYKIINNNYISETESVFLCQENGIIVPTCMCLSREVWLANIIIQRPCPEYRVTIILQQWIGLDRIALRMKKFCLKQKKIVPI